MVHNSEGPTAGSPSFKVGNIFYDLPVVEKFKAITACGVDLYFILTGSVP
jgi:hypothetical protein